MFSLKSKDHAVELMLDILGYEFPDLADDWCLLKVTVRQDDDLFEKTDPALEASDFCRLYAWFNALADRRLPSSSHLRFTEPCLELAFVSCIDNVVRIAVILNCELKPDFTQKHPYISKDDWRLLFDLDENDFSQILSAIQKWIENYPSRVEGENN